LEEDAFFTDCGEFISTRFLGGVFPVLKSESPWRVRLASRENWINAYTKNARPRLTRIANSHIIRKRHSLRIRIGDKLHGRIANSGGGKDRIRVLKKS
jgi:hypothetical protein